jgi:hypothetical protein
LNLKKYFLIINYMQSVIADPIIYDKVSKDDFSESPFLDRQMLYVQDSNNLNYSTNQVVFDTGALSSSGKWLDYSESYLSFPVYMCASTDTALDYQATAGVHADYLLGLKSGSHQLIHSVNLDYNGANVIQPNGFVNMLTNYNMVTSFSQEDIRKLNASIFFNPPTDDSWIWSPNVRTSFGAGLCDNNNFPQTTGHSLGENNARVMRGNQGFLETQKAMVGPFAIPADGNYDSGVSSNTATAIMTNGIQNTQYVNKQLDVAGCHVKRFMACIRLKDIHDFFGKLPLLRMANMRLTLNINNASFTVLKSAHANGFNPSLLAVTGPVLSLAQPVSLANGTNPMIIASSFGSSALNSSAGACITSGVAVSNITCSVSVGQILNTTHRAIANVTAEAIASRWYVPSYAMMPQYVSKYLSMGTKKVTFEDFLCVQVNAPNSSFTQMLTPSLKNVLRVVVVPHCATASFITTGSPCAQVASPFCDNFTFPMIGGGLSQLNIRLGGVDVVASGGHRFGYEFFRSQMPCGINAGLTDGFSSGLINEKNWTKGQFQYYTIDCSRRLLEQENVPQSVEITGTNLLNGGANGVVGLLLYCFVIFKREVVIDIATSAIVG